MVKGNMWSIGKDDISIIKVNALDSTMAKRDVVIIAKNCSNRIGDVSRLKTSGGHLIEQRLKRLKIMLVNDCHVGLGPS